MLGLGNGITGGAALSEFDLTSVSSLQAWYKFDTNITLNGSDVAGWGDNSGNSNDLRQTTASKQPAYNSGDIHFDGSDDFLGLSSNLDFNSGFTVMAVISTDTTSSSNQTLFSGAATGKNFFRYDSTLWRFRPESGSQSQGTVIHELTNGEKFLLTVVGSISGSTLNFAVRDNGSAIGNSNCPEAVNSGKFQFTNIATHAGASNQYWDGKISEFAVFDSALSGDDLTNAEDDLMTRHAIS
jgi:hypothetical protein